VAGLRLASALGTLFSETCLLLSRRALGVTAYLAGRGVRRSWPLLLDSAEEWLRQLARSSLRIAERGATRSLVAIGWRAETSPGPLQVITRPFLPAEFTVSAPFDRLPALYRHLFRLEPIRDPRFLVGREREMAAIREARVLRETGRPASLIIVGERGSGKSSLINCALKQVLSGVDLASAGGVSAAAVQRRAAPRGTC
jgi:hypothetical protein